MRKVALLADTMLTLKNSYASNLYSSIYNVIKSDKRAFRDTVSPIGKLTDSLRCFFIYPATKRIIDTDPRYWECGTLPPKQFVNYPDKVTNRYTLLDNFPNPFNPVTTVQFDIPKESRVSLKIFNVLGQEIADVVHKSFQTGKYSITIDANQMKSGMYFYRLTAFDTEGKRFTSMKKMIVLK